MATIELEKHDLDCVAVELQQVEELVKPIKLEIALIFRAMEPNSTKFNEYLEAEESRMLSLQKEELQPYLEEFMLETFEDINLIELNAKNAYEKIRTILASDINEFRNEIKQNTSKALYTEPNILLKEEIQHLEDTLKLIGSEQKIKVIAEERIDMTAKARMEVKQVLECEEIEEVISPKLLLFKEQRILHSETEMIKAEKREEEYLQLEQKYHILQDEIANLKVKIGNENKYYEKEIMREVLKLMEPSK